MWFNFSSICEQISSFQEFISAVVTDSINKKCFVWQIYRVYQIHSQSDWIKTSFDELVLSNVLDQIQIIVKNLPFLVSDQQTTFLQFCLLHFFYFQWVNKLTYVKLLLIFVLFDYCFRNRWLTKFPLKSRHISNPSLLTCNIFHVI